MARTRVLVCAHCGEPFTAAMRPGPPPKYCSPAHRQRAHEQRHRGEDAEALRRAAEQIQALKARIQWLERDNTLLRDELTETAAEYRRLYRELHPLPPGSVDFSQPGIHIVGLEPQDQPPARRGWRRPRDRNT